MRQSKTITIPAETKTVTSYICDECGKEILWRYKCTECNADLCGDHSRVHPETITEDNTTSICNKCLDIFKQYQPTIDDLEKKIEEIRQKRKEHCITNRQNPQ